MNNFPSKEIVERLRKEYPKGTRIALVKMNNDPYSKLVPGDRGTVKFIDDAGTIFPNWDKGGSLGIAYGEDSCRKLTDEELAEEQNQNNDQELYEPEMTI